MDRTVTLGILDSVRIASPCPVRWEDMTGDDKKRHCANCNLHVYDLSAMTRQEAEELVNSRTDRLCATFYRRSDGTILTRDCPVGLALVRQRLARVVSRVGAVVGMLLTGVLLLGAAENGRMNRLSSLEPFASIRKWLSIGPVPPGSLGPRMAGEICVIAPSPTPGPAGTGSSGGPGDSQADAPSESPR